MGHDSNPGPIAAGNGFPVQRPVQTPDLSDAATSSGARGRGGGPKTPAGKRRSRENALTHGLTATSLLPEALGEEKIDRHFEALSREWQPQSPTETLLVREMARHAAALERIERIEPAVLRVGACRATMLLKSDGLLAEPHGGDGRAAEDLLLAAAVAGESVDRLIRYRRSHEMGWHLALRRLEERQPRRAAGAGRVAKAVRPPAAAGDPVKAHRNGEAAPAPCATARFPDEPSCAAYLAAWARKRPFRCPQCGHDGAAWVTSRHVRQCRKCRRQVGARHDTVMAGSRLPLRTWFGAIACLLGCPDAGADEVAEMTGLPRRKTVRGITRRIRSAIGSPQASRLLAGLDAVFSGPDVEPLGAGTGCLRRPRTRPLCETNSEDSQASTPAGDCKP